MAIVRSYTPADHDAVVALADRLLIGRPAWRDGERWREVARSWVEGSAAAASDNGHAFFVAVEGERIVGLVSGSTRTHFTGDVDAYIGELVVDASAEGTGVGGALLRRIEGWAVEQGHTRITLETGAANDRARTFYDRAGYADEDVRLTKIL